MQMRLGIRPTVDFAFKKIFGTPENVPILLGLVNAVLQLRDPLVDVEILNPFSYQEFQNDKLIVLDIRARDAAGRWLNIEMQVSVYPGLLQRLAYYACALYVDQLQLGQHYTRLRPAISISLLNQVLFSDTPAAHHRFRLVDPEHRRQLPESIEVHTVELTKYNLEEATISTAPAIGQWAFFFLRADRYEPARLRELLPGEPFQRAITALETIAAKTEDRQMYDQREKAQRDYQWALDSVREEGWEKGREEGLERGREEGLERGREEGLERGREEGLERGLELGRDQGLELGRREGLVGTIQLLRQLMSEEEGSTSDLRQRSLEELTALQTELQQRLRRRENG
jgi:predicted transposase/invertase (TIGR01784 family)